MQNFRNYYSNLPILEGSVLKFMALNASVKQQLACGLREIGLQLEF